MPNWASSLSRDRYACPRCHAPAGQTCREPSGRKKSQGLCVHGERMQLLTEAEWESCKGTALTGSQFIAKVIADARRTREEAP